MSTQPALSDATKRRLKSLVLELRHLLEDDLGRELARLGLDATQPGPVPLARLAYLTDSDKRARAALEAVLAKEQEAAGFAPAVLAVQREAAYTHLNRWIGLKCLELRGHLVIEGEKTEAITCRPEYGGRSKWLWTLRARESAYRFGEDAEERLWHDGLLAACAAVTREIGVLFDPGDPYAQVWPSHQALRQAIAELNELPEEAFRADELLGWVYQYFQTEEKARVFEEVRTQKKKVAGADIIPVTQLYTERYMVDFLLQNSIGTRWMEMYPDSDAKRAWPYYVTPATPHTRPPKPLKEWTILDPCAGSGHFLVVAFDLLQQLYTEERRLAEAGRIPREWVVPEGEIAVTILERNLHGIDIDARAVQLASLALYLKAKEAGLSRPPRINVVAADASFMQGPAWERFLAGFEREPSVRRVLQALAASLKDIRELGSLLRPEAELRRIIAEEHRAWEKRARRGEEQLALFPELEAPRQGELPFEQVTDERFWEELAPRAENAIRAFLKQARDRREIADQVVAGEAQRGFAFLELCQRRYDVVCTNPPYMGRANMGAILRRFVVQNYEPGSRDLCTAFIMRCLQWAMADGHVGMVTQQSWLFLRRYCALRAMPLESKRDSTPGFAGLLRDTTIQTLGHLGPGAFSEVGGEVVNVVLFTLRNSPLAADHCLVGFRLVTVATAEAKAEALRLQERATAVRQAAFLSIPESPVVYWLSQPWLDLLARGPRFESVAFVREGLHTTDNARFLRCFWECGSFGEHWVPYLKGGGYARWAGLDWLCVDWEDDGRRIRSTDSPVIPSYDLYFLPGFTYTDMASGALALRHFGAGYIFDAKGPVIVAKDGPIDALACLANTRPVTYMLRALSPTFQFRTGYVNLIPIPKGWESLAAYGRDCVRLASIQRGVNPTERLFRDAPPVFALNATGLSSGLEGELEVVASLQLSIEALAEESSLRMYCLAPRQVDEMSAELGIPAGWHPLLTDHDAVPVPPNCHCQTETDVAASPCSHPRNTASSHQASDVRSRLRALYFNGPGFGAVGDGDEPEGADPEAVEGEDISVAGRPIPSDSFLEELSRSIQIHPISVHWLLEEMRREEGLVCPPELQRHTADYLSVKLLRMLGHRWPVQDQYEQEEGKPFLDPQWIDKDGILALVGGTGEETLVDRLRRYLDSEFGPERGPDVEREAGMILGWSRSDEWGKQKATTLETWFQREFFKRHVSQFKRRPIAWHLRSPRGAFQAIVSYHKFDKKRLALLRARYVRTLLELRRRELAEAQATGLLDRQALARAEALETEVADIQEFDERLRRLQEGRDRETRIWCPWKKPEEQPVGWDPDINDGVRVNIAPVQRMGLLAADVLNKKDLLSLLAPEGRN